MSNSGTPKLVFLLGSGISYKAGMPSMEEITKRVLSGEGIYYDGENFSCRVPAFVEPAKNKLEKEQRDAVQRIAKFLSMLKVEIDYYYDKHKFKQDINYEDLYYMTRQIYDSQAGEYDNPAIQPLVDNISYDISPLLVRAPTRTKWTLSGFAKTAMKYIEYVVFHELQKETNRLDYLSYIKEACKD